MFDWLGLLTGILYDADGAGSGSDSASTSTDVSTSSTPETPDPAKNQNSGGISQEEMNRIAAKARSEGKTTAIKALLEELGLENHDDLKVLVKTAKDQQAAQMSEADKLRAQLEKAETDLKAQREAAANAERQAILERRDSAVKTALRDANVRKDDADDAFILMRERGVLEDLLSEDGKVDPKVVEAAVAKFKAEKPAYFAPTSPGSPSNKDGRAPSSEEAFRAAVEKRKQQVR